MTCKLLHPRIFLVIVLLLLVALPVAVHAGPSELRIGVVAPLSGKSARYGQFIREGLELARDELQARARKVELIYEDDQCLPALGVTATNKLIEIDRVNAIYGGWCSSVVLAQAPIAERHGVLLMASAIAPQIKHAGKFVYRMQPDASLYVSGLVQFLFNEQKLKQWAILAHQSDFGLESAKLFSQTIKEDGGLVLAFDEYIPDTADFRAQLSKMITKSPQGLFLAGYTEVGLIMKQARNLGFKGQFAGLTTLENQDVLTAAGSTADGALYTSHFDPDGSDVSTLNFQRRYFAKFGHRAEHFAAVAYEGLNIYAEVFEKCANDTACAQGLLNSSTFQGIATRVSFDEYGDPVRPIVIRQIRNGSFVTVARHGT